VKPVVPQAEQGDEYGQHVCALMGRMAKLGVKAALEAEIAKPSWDDPDYCRMVVRLAGDSA